MRDSRRERNSWVEERQGLLDKVMLLKGYREFAPELKVQEVEPVWEEESEEEGFFPV